jgi:hypothetical protein
MVLNADDENIDQTDNWTESEDAEALTRYGISPNHLFGIEAEETTTTTTTEPTKEAGTAAQDETTTVDLTAPENSPERKRTKSTDVPSSIKESNRYTTQRICNPLHGARICPPLDLSRSGNLPHVRG